MTSQTDSTHHISLADEIESARRIVIKIGSALLFDGKSGEARQHWLDRLGDDIAALSRQGKEVIIVSSGSIALGRQILGLKKLSSWKPNRPPPPQDRLHLSSYGQMRLLPIT